MGGGNSNGGAGSVGGGPGGGAGGGFSGVCGDGQWGGNEQCDDGNAASGDGCSSGCRIEPNYACDELGTPCQPVVCGDGRAQSYVDANGNWHSELCDDGNAASNDGCSSTCAVEDGWTCGMPGTPCRQPVCGDSQQDSWFVSGPGGGGGGAGGSGPGGTYYYEECDDGNAVSGDGCTSTCTIESGWVCTGPGVACHQPKCGDGIIDYIAGSGGSGAGGNGSGGFASGGSSGSTGYGSYEACDDGNLTPGDGCDATCAVEPGWACMGAGTCHPIVCGDGFADYPQEQCDDGNAVANDGCTACAWDKSGVGGFAGASPGGAAGAAGAAGMPGGGFGGSL